MGTSRTYEDIGAILRSMNHEQREVMLELVAIMAFTCTTTSFGIFPPVDVDAITDRVAAKLDEMAVRKPTDADFLWAEKAVIDAQAHRDRTYRIWGNQHGHLATDTKLIANKRVGLAQAKLIELREASV